MSQLSGTVTAAAKHRKGFKLNDGDWVNSVKELNLKQGDEVTFNLNEEGKIISYTKGGGNGATTPPPKHSFTKGKTTTSTYQSKWDPKLEEEKNERIARSHGLTTAEKILANCKGDLKEAKKELKKMIELSALVVEYTTDTAQKKAKKEEESKEEFADYMEDIEF